MLHITNLVNALKIIRNEEFNDVGKNNAIAERNSLEVDKKKVYHGTFYG